MTINLRHVLKILGFAILPGRLKRPLLNFYDHFLREEEEFSRLCVGFSVFSPPMTTAASSAIEAKIQDLCAAIAADSSVVAARENAEAFLADENAVDLYREVMNLGRSLESRHRQGESIPDSDIQEFEDLQAKADTHEGIRAFNEAQGVLQEIASKVNTFVTKTLEKGRVPTSDEVTATKGCGEGCGCH